MCAACLIILTNPYGRNVNKEIYATWAKIIANMTEKFTDEYKNDGINHWISKLSLWIISVSLSYSDESNLTGFKLSKS